MRARRTVALALTGLLAAAALAACSNGDGNNAANTSSSAATVLNVGMPNGPQTENHNPFLGSSFGRLAGLPLDDLRAAGDDRTAIKPAEPGKPWLATKWKWSARLHQARRSPIRDNVKWSDGQPMTADDVAYSFQLLQGQRGRSTSDAIPYGTITASRQQGRPDLRPGPQFVNQTKILTAFVVPKHQWSTIDGPDHRTRVKNPIGTGPYTLKSFTPQTVTLTLRATRTGRTCRRSRSCATPRTTTTTRRPPR